MKKSWWFRKCLCPALRILLLVLLAVNWPCHLAAQEIKVDNIRFELKEDCTEIYYDLAGSPYKDYRVPVVLKREQDPRFSFKPASVQGDVGKGRFAGEAGDSWQQAP